MIKHFNRFISALLCAALLGGCGTEKEISDFKSDLTSQQEILSDISMPIHETTAMSSEEGEIKVKRRSYAWK